MRLHRRAALPGYEQQLLARAPEGDSATEMVIRCWRDLEGERTLGFGAVGLIPYRAIRAWAVDERLDRELFQMLIAVIQKLDADRLDRDAAKRALKAGGK